MEWAKTTAKRDEKHLNLGFGVTDIRCLMVHSLSNRWAGTYCGLLSFGVVAFTVFFAVTAGQEENAGIIGMAVMFALQVILPRFTVSCMKLVMIFLLCNNLFIYQVLCTLIYRRRSLYSFLFYACWHRNKMVSIFHMAFSTPFSWVNYFQS